MSFLSNSFSLEDKLIDSTAPSLSLVEFVEANAVNDINTNDPEAVFVDQTAGHDELVSYSTSCFKSEVVTDFHQFPTFTVNISTLDYVRVI